MSKILFSSLALLKMIRQLSTYLIIKIFLVILIHNAQSNAIDFPQVYNSSTDIQWLELKEKKIATPTEYVGDITLAPNRPPNKTEIDIDMFAEIIEFDVKLQQFTIRMGFIINWTEKRLLLKNSSFVNGWINVPLNTIWSPQIDIQSVEVSEKRTTELIDVTTDSQSGIITWDHLAWDSSSKKYGNHITYFVQSSTVRMKFSLTTTVKCNFNFEMFPFDSHICKLGVS